MTPRSTVWARDNRERKLATQKAWVKAHPEKAREYKRKYDAKNRDKIRERQKSRDATPEGRAATRARGFRRFGITASRYWELYRLQIGVCAICRQPECDTNRKTGEPKLLAIDHDHSTGKVRGLLCSKCNTGLGLMMDDVALLGAAICYLKIYSHQDAVAS